MDTTPRDRAPEGLIDVTEIPVKMLWSIEHTPNLAKSKERILAAVRRAPVSAFNSAI